MSVYLLHFDTPLAHARHYLGFADDVPARIAKHRAGRGARLTQVLKEQGIDWRLARVWEGATRSDERRFKNQKNAKRYCPVCAALSPQKAAARQEQEDNHHAPL